MKRNLDIKKILFLISFLLLNSFFIFGEEIQIENIYSEKVLEISEMKQLSDEEFNFYDDEEGKLKNKDLIYWIVLSGLILIFIVVFSYTIYLFFKKEKAFNPQIQIN